MATTKSKVKSRKKKTVDKSNKKSNKPAFSRFKKLSSLRKLEKEAAVLGTSGTLDTLDTLEQYDKVIKDESFFSKLGLPFLEFEIRFITPELAKLWISDMRNNRPVRPTRVRQYSRVMTAGNWFLMHQGIAFDEEGHLLDGQHRLLAIIASGLGQWFAVCYGVPCSAYDKMDKGAARSVADSIAVSIGPKYRTRLSSLARFILNGPSNHIKLEDTDIVLFIKKHYDLMMGYIPRMSRGVLKPIYNAGVGAAFISSAILYGKDKADALLDRVVDMNWQADRDPMKAMYTALVNNHGLKRVPDMQACRYWICVTGIKTAIRGRKVKTIRVRPVMGDLDGVEQLRHNKRK